MRVSTHFKDRLRLTGVCCLTNWRWIGPAKALQGVGILTSAEEVRQRRSALDRIGDSQAKDKAWLDSSDAEDVHHFVEKALVEELSALG